MLEQATVRKPVSELTTSDVAWIALNASRKNSRLSVMTSPEEQTEEVNKVAIAMTKILPTTWLVDVTDNARSRTDFIAAVKGALRKNDEEGDVFAYLETDEKAGALIVINAHYLTEDAADVLRWIIESKRCGVMLVGEFINEDLVDLSEPVFRANFN